LLRACPDVPRPLVPKNVPYFSVRPGDFGMPEIATQIMALYGEDRGDGERRLYRFPVVFPADQWQTIMPHALQCYTKSGLKYWSEYSADGRQRYCMSYAPVPTDANGRRVVRIWGGRKHVQREENGGICDPEVCPEYQAKQCNLTGRFIFFVPGINSIHPLELGTNSFYSMQSVRETLEQIAFMRGGRISGFLDGRQQTFFMTKKLTEVPHIDEKGVPVRVKHYLISLEAAIDPTRLLRMNDDEEMRLADADRAAAVLSGGDFEVIDGDATEVESAAPAPLVETPPVAHEAVRSERQEAAEEASAPAAVAPPVPQTAEAPAPSATAAAAAVRPGASEGLTELHALLETMGIVVARFEKFAAKKWGLGWNKNPNGIRKAHAEVAASVNDPSRLADRMTAELEELA
jgi:hypothetical protein